MTRHRRPVCINCRRPCGIDEGYKTTLGRVSVCTTCLESHRPQWMRKQEKAERIAALERAVEAAA